MVTHCEISSSSVEPERSSVVKPLTAILFVGLVALILRIGALVEFVCVIGVTISFLINGLPLTTRYLWNTGSWLGFAAVSYFIGLLVSIFAVAITLLIAGWNIEIILMQLVLMNCAAVVVSRRKILLMRGLPLVENIGLYAVLLVFFSVFLPLWNLGASTERGVAFASLFSHDFLFRIGYAAQVARGLSDQSIFMSGLRLPNQFLYFVYPALIYKLAGVDAHLIAIFKFVCVLFSCAFPLLLVDVFRQMNLSRRETLIACALAFVAYSASGPVVVLMRYLSTLPLGVVADKLKSLSDGQTLMSQGLIRDILVEPHSLLVIAWVMCCFAIMAQLYSGEKKYGAYFVAGALGSVCFGVDSFLSLVLVSWLAIGWIALFIKNEISRPRLLIEAFATVAFGLFALFLFSKMGIFDPNSSVGTLLFEPYVQLLKILPIYLVVEYGVAFFTTIAGLCLVLKVNQRERFLALSLLLICLLYMVLIQHAEPNVVQRKSGKMLELALVLLAAMYVPKIASINAKSLRVSVSMAGIGLAVLGMINAVMVIFIFSNINSEKYASFVKAADYRAVRWVIQNTDPAAIVQSLPEYYTITESNAESYEISLFSQLGERAMALGNFKFANYTQTEDDTARKRNIDIRRMFETNSSAEAYTLAGKYKINYVFVGTWENKNFPGAEEKFSLDSKRFESVYQSEGVWVFRVLY